MRLPSGTVLDGELVVFLDEKPSLESIQRRALLQNSSRIQHLSRTTPVTYLVFDLLSLRNTPLMAAPFSVRREPLIKLYQQPPTVTEVLVSWRVFEFHESEYRLTPDVCHPRQ